MFFFNLFSDLSEEIIFLLGGVDQIKKLEK